ncbi:hypothetical protein BDB01DRAFT_849161 [Pilobolus umbonatus]|nr:hypothetical protein BDB01DRAFT_849161 [Pilobolus umbonatus]
MQAKARATLRRGGGSAKRTVRTLNPAIVYDFTLRCAIRAYLEGSKNAKNISKDARANNRHSVHLSGVSDVFGNIADKFGGDEGSSARSDKLNKPIVIGLLRRLDDIRDGKDTSSDIYSDRRFLLVVRQIRDEVKQHRYRPQGSVNDLVISFLRVCEAELKKTNPNPAVWFKDLDRFVAIFAEILLLTLKEDAPSSATPELIESLTRSTLPNKQLNHKQQEVKTTSSTGLNSPGPVDELEQVENFPMVKHVQNLFQTEKSVHRQKIRELIPLCTESNFLIDLKQCINALNTNLSFPGRREDFATQQAYDNWLAREKKQLQELMNVIVMNQMANEQDPNATNLLTGAGGRRSSIQKRNSNGDESPYTFIPNDPRACFSLAMSMCIDLDTEVLPDTERAKIGVLSQASDELLRECWKTWRLSDPFRTVLYLELIKKRLDIDDRYIPDAKNAMRSLDKCLKENDIRNWTINDRENLIRVFEGLNETCLNSLAESLLIYWMDKIELLDKIYENPLYLEDHTDPIQQFNSLEDTIAGAAVSRWRVLEKSVLNPQNDDMTNLMNMANKLIEELVIVAKRFKKPLKNSLHLPGIVMARQMPFFVLEMENWAFLPATKNAPINEVFELYNKVLTLKRIYDQHGPTQKAALFKVESWFLLHVRRWLVSTNDATPDWVRNAIKEDQFKAVSDNATNSSSVIDLFSMFSEAVEFLQNLHWPNSLQNCRFNTALSKVIGIALEQYTAELEDMITFDIRPPTLRSEDTNANSSFFDRARHQLIGDRHYPKERGTPADFIAETCVKINNIEAARIRLDRLYQTMNVDDIADEMREYGSHLPPAVEKTTVDQPPNYLYSIKIVRAENLAPLDKNGLSDPFVVLEIDQKPIATTRTMCETLNPRWDEEFDIWLKDDTVDVLALVYDEDIIGANEECGGVWFKLSPEYFDDYLTHEFKLNLHPQGTLYLRISMEGEKDDIQFWFGKAFRTLKRAENDAAGLIEDKMGHFFRQVLNRKTLDKLLGRDRGFFSLYSRNNRQVDPTHQDCEDALTPLLDYLEKNLEILNNNLSESNMQVVVLRIWKEILVTLERILLPPLSEHPSELKPLDDYEFHVVFKWLELLKILFNGGEDGDAVPLDKLENTQYHALLSINVAYSMETDQLMEAYHTSLKNEKEVKLRGDRKADRSKTVYQSKNTAKRRDYGPRKSATIDIPSAETILRILRMRTGKKVRDFLHTEFEKRNNPMGFKNSQPQAKSHDEHVKDLDIPPVPPIPPAHDITPEEESSS